MKISLTFFKLQSLHHFILIFSKGLNSSKNAPINRSIRRLNGACSAELFRYTIVTQVNGVSYGSWTLIEDEFEETNFVKILQLI